jgi:hypothetical protein
LPKRSQVVWPNGLERQLKIPPVQGIQLLPEKLFRLFKGGQPAARF